MKEELEKKLVESFPILYKNPVGFEFDDGWFQIIWDLSEALEKEILQFPEDERSSCSVLQVKEKYGLLRFYMSESTEEMLKYITDAEEKSGKTCEKCGKSGEIRKGSWVYTSCDEHVRSG